MEWEQSLYIDLFTLKMLALLMCRDSLEIKASLFMDTVIGQEGLDQGRYSISFKNSRLRRAIKKLLFFAEIFPKKY